MLHSLGSIRSLNRFAQKIAVLSQIPKRNPLIPLEKVHRATDKKPRLTDAKCLATEYGWRLVDNA